jgi:hypothetical protein
MKNATLVAEIRMECSFGGLYNELNETSQAGVCCMRVAAIPEGYIVHHLSQ